MRQARYKGDIWVRGDWNAHEFWRTAPQQQGGVRTALLAGEILGDSQSLSCSNVGITKMSPASATTITPFQELYWYLLLI